MKIFKHTCLITIWVLLLSCAGSREKQVPLRINPRNPHYFLFRGKPAILIGSTEHYGAVMNLDFDYITYLNEIAASGLNVTRTFSGAYVEPAGAFGIKKNTLAPAPERYLCPWSRSKDPGYANGGNKFDLSEWDEAYFTRLKDFVAQAGERDIVVELDLFSNYYDTVKWKLSPLNNINNINRVGDFKDYKEVLSLKHPELLRVQESMVRKIIHELKDFDNLYYEVCNEPYFGDTLAVRQWEDHMTEVVIEAENDFEYRHLISNNVANNSMLVPEPRKGVSIYNFHYARPPVTVGMNYHLNSVIGDNETGFDGIDDAKYRIEAWDFILAGGGLFDNLDYSFTTDTEDGTFKIEPGQPGGGGDKLRDQFKILANFMKSLDFVNMRPLNDARISIDDQSGLIVTGLEENDDILALYLHRKDASNAISVIEVELSAGSYNMIWTDPKKGTQKVASMTSKKKGWIKITTPSFSEDLALKIVKSD
jgi:Cellulase (glycosyl hydrolase family 5)